jgi:hypothetical protein
MSVQARAFVLHLLLMLQLEPNPFFVSFVLFVVNFL